MEAKLQDLPLTRETAHFVATAPFGQFPDTAREGIKIVILDTIGVALAAAPHKVGRLVTAFATEAGGDQVSTILGGGRKASAPMAALANATMSNALDFDEGFHISTHVIPAAMAVAERDNLSGAQLIDGAMIGYEFGARLTKVVDAKRREKKGPTAHGWWHVGLCGPLAAAVTAARLMRLDETTTRTAIGIASCSSAGFRRNMGTMAKGLHSGHAARAGIEAAGLARAGFTADDSIIESPLGFIAAMCGPDEFDASGLHGMLGNPFVLEKGPEVKAYPACTPGHSLIELGIRLHPRIAARLDEIERVDADLHGFSLLRPAAEDEDAAGFSGAYLLAAALVHGAFDLSHVTAAAVQDARVRALMAKIHHRPARKGTEIVDIRLRSGETFTDEGTDRPRRLTTPADVDAKFIACCDHAIGKEAGHKLLARLRRLESEASLGALMDLARG